MKNILLIVFTIGIGMYTATGQKIITLSANNTHLTPGTIHYNSALLSNFAAPVADTNHAWNYSGLVFSAKDEISYIINPFLFSGSSLSVAEIGQREKLTSADTLNTNYIYDEDTLAIYQAGTFLTAQNFSLYNYFSNPKDSLYVPQQADYCRINILNFPTTAKSVFKRTSIRSLNFKITVTSEGYKNASGIKNTYFTLKDTVIGWGTLRIPSPNKASIPHNVLLLKRKTIAIDSVFINKKVPNPVYLTALGINQGNKIITYEHFFYRAGYANPIMSVNYGKDSTCTVPVSILYATDSVKSLVKIDEDEIDNFSLYPNPAMDGSANCRFTKTSPQAWKIMVVNTLGQLIVTQNITGIGEMSLQIAIDKVKTSGTCFVNIIDENGQKIASAKLSILR